MCQNITDVVKVFVKETLAVVHQAPFTHDAPAAGYDSAKPLFGQVHIVPADSRMNGEVVHSLLALFYQCVAIQFPRQVLYFAVYLFQCLIDGYRTHRNRAVAYDPFPCFVYVFSR